MRVTFEFFGRLGDAAGAAQQEADLPDTVQDTDGLTRWLKDRHPAGAALTSLAVRLAINDELVSATAPITAGDRIAFLPPVGGG